MYGKCNAEYSASLHLWYLRLKFFKKNVCRISKISQTDFTHLLTGSCSSLSKSTFMFCHKELGDNLWMIWPINLMLYIVLPLTEETRHWVTLVESKYPYIFHMAKFPGKALRGLLHFVSRNQQLTEAKGLPQQQCQFTVEKVPCDMIYHFSEKECHLLWKSSFCISSYHLWNLCFQLSQFLWKIQQNVSCTKVCYI